MNFESVGNEGGGASSASTRVPVLDVHALSKSFNGVRALQEVNLQINPGEVHGLLGANGCGKSTLIKILAGFYQAEGGRVHVNGREIALPLGPRGLRQQGVAFVHQDLGLVPDSTVLEHLALDFYGASSLLKRINWASERNRAAELLDRFDVDVDPGAMVDTLSPVQRAMVAVVRAVGHQESEEQEFSEAKLLVLDEPTVFLPSEQVDVLFNLLQKLKEGGDSVLLVSHDLDEVLASTDRVTVLRDGKLIGSRNTQGSTRADVVEMILGQREVHAARSTFSHTKDTITLLKADKIAGERVRDLSIELRAGEVLGVTGLAGSGFEELPELLFGARPLRAGTVTVAAEEIRDASPARLMSRQVVLIPSDRKADGAAQGLTMVENLSLPFINDHARGWKIGWQKLRVQAQAICERLNVVPPNVELTFGNLSGGNQQKALIGKWLETNPKVMLLNEPTQGVDIGARREIFKLVRATVSDGVAVLCATSDYEQLVEMADRVIILSNGRLNGELVGDEITKDSLAASVYAKGAT